jgi:hypothetical protein
VVGAASTTLHDMLTNVFADLGLDAAGDAVVVTR